jgi:ABC-type transport system involved in cytochrome c biogenesis permease subunit
MTFDANALLGLGYACFIVTLSLHIYYLLRTERFVGQLATIIELGGLLLWTSGFVWQILQNEAWRRIELYDLLLLLPIVWVLISLVEAHVYGVRIVSALVLVFVVLLGAYTLFSWYPRATAMDVRDIPSRSAWFVSYYLFAVWGYGMLLTAGVWGIVELLRPLFQNRINEYALLPETSLETFTRKSVLWALVVLTFSLALGAWWAWLASGQYWHWTVVEVSMLATWLVYAAYFHLRRFRGWAILSVLAMVLAASSIGALAI